MLRTRLFLNLLPFALILLAIGVYAIVLFSRLAGSVDTAVTENYRSIMAAQAMSLALAAMEREVWAAAGARNADNQVFEGHQKRFEENLAWQLKRMWLPGEAALNQQLTTNYLAFQAAMATLGSFSRPESQRQFYQQQVVPSVLTIDVTLGKIRDLNHQAILKTSENIQVINRHITYLMVIGVAAAFMVSAFASLHLARAILQPIQLLTKATREIGQGNLDQIVPVVSNDELGELANAFNKMAGLLKAYRQSTTEKIIRLHGTMESALASFPDPIFILDRDGRIELKNPAAADLDARLELHDTLPAHLPETVSEVLRAGKDFLPHSFDEVLTLRVNGEERSFLPRILSMRGEEDQSVGVVVVLHDVTRFRLLDDAKTNLVATVSHELKTPLTSVRMVLHLLLERTLGPLTRKQEELLQTARQDAERLLQILNDLLDLTRLDAGNSGLNQERISPAELVQSVCDEAQQRASERGLVIACSAQPQLPPVLVDRERIGHVFRNFITNAVKHSPPGGEIQVRAALTDNGGIQFSVSDQGPGVPEEYQPRIFDRFFRVPGQTKTGAGLGLSIAREITVAHGGRIGVRSQAGKGSEFYIVLASAEEEPSV